MVACGWRHTISVSSSGGLYTYGWSKYGQLGHGNFEDSLVPHKLQALSDELICQVSPLILCWVGVFIAISCIIWMHWHIALLCYFSRLYLPPVLLFKCWFFSLRERIGNTSHLWVPPCVVCLLRTRKICSNKILSYPETLHTGSNSIFVVRYIVFLFVSWLGLGFLQVSGGWRHSMALTSTGLLYGWGWNKVCSKLIYSLVHVTVL